MLLSLENVIIMEKNGDVIVTLDVVIMRKLPKKSKVCRLRLPYERNLLIHLKCYFIT